jgi:hypothetical protein
MGWGRAAVIPIFGGWPVRYALFATPILCTTFFIWELYGSTKLRSIVQSGLLVGMFLLIPANAVHGFWWANWFLKADKLLQQDLASGASLSTIVERHGNLLFPHSDPIRLADMIRMLRDKDIAPFNQISKNSVSTEDVNSNPAVPQRQLLINREMRYQMPEAGEVFLVWGINGWKTIPEEIRPAGTEVKNEIMRTPMIHEGDTFIAKVQVPVGTTIDYGFLITKKQDGTAVNIWEANGEQDYHMIVAEDGILGDKATAILAQDQVSESAALPSLVTQEMRYQMPEAGEVFLVWGINGWQMVPEQIRPAETTVKGKLMRTPMTRQGETFITKVQVPTGSTLEYGFLITKKRNGDMIKSVWDGAQRYQKTASKDGIIAVKAAVALPQDQVSIALTDRPLITQEIQYYLPEAGEVFLIWGIDGWQPLPEQIRPANTQIENKFMRTLMVREDNVFVTKIQVPTQVTLNYGFSITDKPGIWDVIRPVWDGNPEYQLTISENGVIEVKPELTIYNEWSDVFYIKAYLLAGIGLLLAIWPLIFLFLTLLNE